MFHPESNPLAPKSTRPLKPEKDLVEIWLGPDAAALMEDEKPEAGDEDLNPKKHELTEKEKRTLWEMKRPDEVTLKNVPKWKELPDPSRLEADYELQSVWEDEYRKGRPLSDFTPQPEETPPSFQGIDVLSHAKVLDIADAITKAKAKDPEHPNYLTTAEVFEVIDAAGYRPATLEELLAYARDYWKPDANPKTLTKEERELQNAQAPYIFGLNSVFSIARGRRRVPYLDWSGGERVLYANDLEDAWNAPFCFLVLRKSLPS